MIQAERSDDRTKDCTAKRQRARVGDRGRWPVGLVDPEHSHRKIGCDDTTACGLNRIRGGSGARADVEHQLAGQVDGREADEHFCEPVVDEPTRPVLPGLPRSR